MDRVTFETREALDKEVAALKEKGWSITGPHVPPQYATALIYYATMEAKQGEMVEGAAMGQRTKELYCPMDKDVVNKILAEEKAKREAVVAKEKEEKDKLASEKK